MIFRVAVRFFLPETLGGKYLGEVVVARFGSLEAADGFWQSFGTPDALPDNLSEAIHKAMESCLGVTVKHRMIIAPEH